MKLKCKVDNNGGAYLALIDPESNEHRKSATIAPGQEIECVFDEVTDPAKVSFGDVVASEGDEQPDNPAAGEGADTAGEDTPEEGEGEESDERVVPAGLAPGRMVTVRHPDGYDAPAVVIATSTSISDGAPELSSPSAVHVTVFTTEGAGCYPALDIPQALEGDDIPAGTWRWPERV